MTPAPRAAHSPFPRSRDPAPLPQAERAPRAFPPVRVRGRLTRGGAAATSAEGAKMAAAGGGRRGPAGRALCLLLLCGWALAARGQDSLGERQGAGRGGAGCGLWALRGPPAGLSQRSFRWGLERCAASAGAGCELTGPGLGLWSAWGWDGVSLPWAVLRGRAEPGRGTRGRPPGVPRFCCCEEHCSWLLHSSELGFFS